MMSFSAGPAREAAQAVCVIAKAMMMQGHVAVCRPAEFGFLVPALSHCLHAATAAFERQPNGPTWSDDRAASVRS